MDFPVGSRKLHPDPNFNYQLNRTALWSGGDWDELDALPNVRSLTYRLFTERENAGTHCSAGNVKLVLDFISNWIDLVKRTDENTK